MRILITGATGYIANKLVKRLVEFDNAVWCTVRKTSDVSRLENIDCELIYVDEVSVLYEQLRKIRPDLVIHLAGVFLSEHSKDNIQDMVESNIVFPTILFDAAYEAGCRKYINTGTCWQNFEGEKYNPVNLYAATKESVEDILKYYVNAKGIKGITLTIFDSYGPKDTRNKVLNIVSRLSEGESIGMTQGEQKMYLCYIDDIVDAYLQAIILIQGYEEGEYHKYAVRGDKAYSLREIIQIYLEESRKNVIIKWGEREYRKREIMDPSDWGELLPGWYAKTSLKEGMKKYISKG